MSSPTMLPELQHLIVESYIGESQLVLREVSLGWNYVVCRCFGHNNSTIVAQIVPYLETVTKETYPVLRSILQDGLITDLQLQTSKNPRHPLTLACEAGDLPFAQFLHANYPNSMKIEDCYSFTLLLSSALMCRNFDICDWLVDVYNFHGNHTAFGVAATVVDTVEAMQWLNGKMHLDQNTRFRDLVVNVFEQACMRNNVDVVKWIFTAYPNKIQLPVLEQQRYWVLCCLLSGSSFTVWNYLCQHFQLDGNAYIKTAVETTGNQSFTRFLQ